VSQEKGTEQDVDKMRQPLGRVVAKNCRFSFNIAGSGEQEKSRGEAAPRAKRVGVQLEFVKKSAKRGEACFRVES